jgi:hypothetical protein
MRRYRLSIFAIVSLLTGLIIGIGYIEAIRLVIQFNVTHPPFRAIQIWTGEGRMNVLFESSIDTRHAQRIQFGVAGKSISLGVLPPYFASGPFSFPASANPTHYFRASIPIWCVILPCLIAPIMWLRKAKRARSQGFAVAPPRCR